MSVVQSKYTILSNKPVHKGDLGEFKLIAYKLPEWFTNWNKNKIIKVYGCSFVYLDSLNKTPIISSLYTNHFISVHSNIVRDDTANLKSVYILDGYREVNPEVPHEVQDESYINDGFMMVANNFFTPKIYDMTNSNITQIELYFKDAAGNVIPLRTPYVENPPEGEGSYHTDGIRQAVFRLEIELAIINPPQ
jgi:hypothetical protein